MPFLKRDGRLSDFPTNTLTGMTGCRDRWRTTAACSHVQRWPVSALRPCGFPEMPRLYIEGEGAIRRRRDATNGGASDLRMALIHSAARSRAAWAALAFASPPVLLVGDNETSTQLSVCSVVTATDTDDACRHIPDRFGSLGHSCGNGLRTI